MTRITILRAAGNELTNQLWNYASIFAYARERGYALENPSFFEYGENFSMYAAPSWLFRILFFLPFRNYRKRKTALKRRIWRKFYTWYAGIREAAHKSQIVRSGLEQAYHLPPSAEATIELHALEESGRDIYFDGWLFRNPLGLEKYREEIREYFTPRKDTATKVEETIGQLRSRYQTILGVHIRQGDYRQWRGGAYFLGQTRVREIVDEYLKEKGLPAEKTCFLITSDGPIDEAAFAGLNTHISRGNAVEDLFLLSHTDAILGANSTFGAFASYLGNIPFMVMENGPMDWEYYRDKTRYFENRYASFVFY